MSMDQEYNYYVGLGLTGTLNDMRAKYYATDGAGVVRGEVDLVTGGVEKINGIGLPGSPVRRRRLTFIPCGELTTHNVGSGVSRTYRSAITTKSRPRRVRLIFANAGTADVTFAGCAVSPATTGVIDNKLWSQSSSSWLAGGAVTVPARVAAGRPSYARSAWIEIDAVESVVTPGTWPIIASALVNTASAAADVTVGAYDMGWAESEGFHTGIYHAHRWQDGDKFTTPSTFTETTVRGASAIIGWEVDCDDGITTIMASGDSITAGAGTTRLGETDIMIAVKAANLAGKLCGYVSAGWGGQNTTTYSDRLSDALSTFRADVVVYSIGSPNDGTPAATVIRKEFANLHKAISAIHDAGAAVVLRGQAPNTSNGWNAAADDLRKALNARAAAMERPIGLTWYMSSVAGLGDGATPERYAAVNTTDNNHPNATGYAAASVNAGLVLTKVAEAIGHFV